MSRENKTIGYYITVPAKQGEKDGERVLAYNRIFPTWNDAYNAIKDTGRENEAMIIDAYASRYVVSSDEANGRARKDYFDDVRRTAESIKEEFEADKDNDRDWLIEHIDETIDGCSRVIYTHNAIDCIRFSDNDSIGFDELGPDGFDFSSGIPWSQIAYFAFRQDVFEQLESIGLDVNNPFKECEKCLDEKHPLEFSEGEDVCKDCRAEEAGTEGEEGEA